MLDQPRIKAILRNMVARAGSSKRAAEICGSAGSDMSLWTSDASDRNIPVDHLLLFDAQVGHLFLEEMARDCGFQLIPLEAKEGSAPTVIRSIAELSRASGELEFTTLEAAEDNHITPAERRRIQDHIAPVKDRLAQLESAIA